MKKKLTIALITLSILTNANILATDIDTDYDVINSYSQKYTERDIETLLRTKLSTAINEYKVDEVDKLTNKYRILVSYIIKDYTSQNNNENLATLITSWWDFLAIDNIGNPIIEVREELQKIYDNVETNKDTDYSEYIYDFEVAFTILNEFSSLYNILTKSTYNLIELESYKSLGEQYNNLAEELGLNNLISLSSTIDLTVGNIQTEAFLEEMSHTATYIPFFDKVKGISTESFKKRPLYLNGKNGLTLATARDLINTYKNKIDSKFYFKVGKFDDWNYHDLNTNVKINTLYNEVVLDTGDNLTTLIMYNSIDNYEYMNPDNLDMPVLVDAIGNILAFDGTVIVPACINVNYYSDNVKYPIMSSAFANSYPQILTDGYDVSLINSHDANKFILLKDTITGNFYADIVGKFCNSGDSIEIKSYDRFLVGKLEEESVANSAKEKVNLLESIEIKNEKTDTNIFGNNINLVKLKDYQVVTESDVYSLSNLIDDKELAETYYLTYLGNDKLKEPTIQRFVSEFGQVVYEYQTNKNKLSADNITNNLASLASSLSKWGGLNNIIGIAHPANNFITKFILLYQSQILNITIIILLLLSLRKYIKSDYQIQTVAITIGLSTTISYLAINKLPEQFYLANNEIVSSLSDKISFNAVSRNDEINLSNQEIVFKSYLNQLPEKSDLSVTLAKSDINYIKDRLDIKGSEFLNKVLYVGDSQCYIYNNEVRIRINDLFDSAEIVGKYVLEDDIRYYKYELKKVKSSSVDYFSPYYIILEEFINTINQYSKISRQPKRTIYNNSEIETSFLVNGYFKSILFMYAEQEDYIKNFIDDKDLDYSENKVLKDMVELIGDSDIAVEDEKHYRKYMFDYLGIYETLTKERVDEESYERIENTLWFRTLEYNKLNGLEDFVTIVNRNTSKYVLESLDRFNYMSDETAMKTIALYATCQFSQHSSKNNYNIYPQKINTEELNLNTLLQVILIDGSQTTNPNTLDIVYYIINKLDTIGALMLVPVYFTEYFINFVLSNFITTIIYLAVFMLMLRVILDGTSKLIKGLIYITSIYSMAYTFNIFKYSIIFDVKDLDKKLAIMLIVNVMISQMLAMLIKQILKDPVNLTGDINALAKITDAVPLVVDNIKNANIKDYMSKKANRKEKQDYEQMQLENTKVPNYENMSINIRTKTRREVEYLLRSNNIIDYRIDGNTINFGKVSDYYKMLDEEI